MWERAILLVKVESSSTSVENHEAGSYKIIHITTLWSIHSSPMYLPKINTNMSPQILFTNIHGDLILKTVNNSDIHQQEKDQTTVT